jgi:hypothetical protein
MNYYHFWPVIISTLNTCTEYCLLNNRNNVLFFIRIASKIRLYFYFLFLDDKSKFNSFAYHINITVKYLWFYQISDSHISISWHVFFMYNKKIHGGIKKSCRTIGHISTCIWTSSSTYNILYVRTISLEINELLYHFKC